MSKLRFFNIFFLKPGLTKTFYLMNDLQFSLVDYVCFMLENFKKYFMIWVVSAEDFVPYLVGFVWSWAFQKCPKIECSSTFKLASRLSSCAQCSHWYLTPSWILSWELFNDIVPFWKSCWYRCCHWRLFFLFVIDERFFLILNMLKLKTQPTSMIVNQVSPSFAN